MTIRAIFQSKTLSLFNYNAQRICQDDAHEKPGKKRRLTSTFTHFSWAKALYSFMSIRSAMVGECEEDEIADTQQNRLSNWNESKPWRLWVNFSLLRIVRLYILSTLEDWRRSSREIQIRLGNCMTRLLQLAVSDYGLIGTAATPNVTVTSHGNCILFPCLA